MVNGTLLNFGERHKDDLRVIFDQWQKLHLGLDALSNQKICIQQSYFQKSCVQVLIVLSYCENPTNFPEFELLMMKLFLKCTMKLKVGQLLSAVLTC
jgi:hypothetical protein